MKLNLRRIPSARRSSAGRKAMSVALVGVTVAGVSVLAVSPASALSWTCKSSSKTIDDAGYSGPWGDNWDFTVTNCVARSGSYVYAKATVKWDAPPWYSGSTDNLAEVFDSAGFRLYLKHADSRRGHRPAQEGLRHPGQAGRHERRGQRFVDLVHDQEEGREQDRVRRRRAAAQLGRGRHGRPHLRLHGHQLEVTPEVRH